MQEKLNEILEAVAQEWRVLPMDIRARRGGYVVSDARRAFVHIAGKTTELCWSEIGEWMGGGRSANAIYSLNDQAARLKEKEPGYSDRINKLVERFL